MTRDEALNVITVMATAWPYPEWDEGRVELWCSALAGEDYDVAREAAADAVREREKAPSVKWMLDAISAVAHRAEVWSPPVLEAPVSKNWRAGLAAAREAINRGAALAQTKENR